MILQTGGFAAGFTSTRSRPRWRAAVIASARPSTPRDLPSASMTRTSRARILLFARMNAGFKEIIPLGSGVQTGRPAHRKSQRTTRNFVEQLMKEFGPRPGLGGG